MSYFKRLVLLGILCFSVFFLSCGKPGPADLVLYGGKVATVDEGFTIQEAVAVRGNKIVFVGSNEKVQGFIYPRTNVIDCQGKLVLPGLIDAHAHLHSLGEELTSLNITGTKSFEEIIEKVAQRVESCEPGEWIVGGRWDQNDWQDTSFPVHDALSAASPDNPVYLTRIDGNAAFANAKALELAGITKDTPDPFGGVIVRKPDGQPTGVLVNRAMNAVLAEIPEDTEAQFKEKFLKAINACLRAGRH